MQPSYEISALLTALPTPLLERQHVWVTLHCSYAASNRLACMLVLFPLIYAHIYKCVVIQLCTFAWAQAHFLIIIAWLPAQMPLSPRAFSLHTHTHIYMLIHVYVYSCSCCMPFLHSRLHSHSTTMRWLTDCLSVCRDIAFIICLMLIHNAWKLCKQQLFVCRRYYLFVAHCVSPFSCLSVKLLLLLCISFVVGCIKALLKKGVQGFAHS